VTGELSRRQLLAGSGLASAALLAASGSVSAGAATTSAVESDSTVPFDGTHQAGIVTREQTRMVFAAYDVTAADATGLESLLAQWTHAAERLTAGKALTGPGGQFAPPPDTGEALGLPASRLTLTVGFGPSLFDARFGLGRRRPEALVDLPPFAGDALDPSLSGGDLCIQACADDPQVAFHAVHNLTRLALGSATVRYLQVGFGRTAASGAGGQTPRNLLGFHDGTSNLDPTDRAAMDRYVWVDRGTDQPWMTGGTYLVARRIRIHLEAWDRSTLEDQQQTIGRIKASGAPLGGTSQSDPVNLQSVGPNDQTLIPDNAHIRVAAPSTNSGQAILRRGYSFADGVDPESGELDVGLYFICFQKDPRQQFIPIQTRLSQNDALAEYLLHTGSGIFACPPGAAGGGSLGDGLS
jgi:deferrochelatase/peroxidase EfeB